VRRAAACLCVAAALILAPLAARAQEPAPAADGGVTAALATPPGEFTVGDPVTLKLTVAHPPGTVIDYPDATALATGADGPGGAPFMVEEVDPVEAKPPMADRTSWTIRIRLFAPGEIRIPAIRVTYRLPGGEEKGSVSTDPLVIRVRSVLSGPEEEPADIKGQWRLPREWWRIILIVALLAALAAVALLAWRRYRRRRAPAAGAPAPAPAAPPEAAWIRAMRDLEALLAAHLLEQGRIKEFHVILSEIVKRFLGEQYGFDALDRTTEEVLRDLGALNIQGDLAGGARVFLEACDLVKFAKHAPGPDAIRATVAGARALIETGRPRPGEEVAAA